MPLTVMHLLSSISRGRIFTVTSLPSDRITTLILGASVLPTQPH